MDTPTYNIPEILTQDHIELWRILANYYKDPDRPFTTYEENRLFNIGFKMHTDLGEGKNAADAVIKEIEAFRNMMRYRKQIKEEKPGAESTKNITMLHFTDNEHICSGPTIISEYVPEWMEGFVENNDFKILEGMVKDHTARGLPQNCILNCSKYMTQALMDLASILDGEAGESKWSEIKEHIGDYWNECYTARMTIKK